MRKPEDFAPEVADHVRKAIDQTPWVQIIQQINPCSSCPARSGIAARASYCDVCPIRPLMLSLAELQLRQAATRKTPAPKPAPEPTTHLDQAGPADQTQHPTRRRPR